MNNRSLILPLLAPLLLLGLAFGWLLQSNTLNIFDSSAPPAEELTFETVYLDADGIHMKMRAGGSEPMVIAQIQVDSAYWKFTQTPAGPIPRMSSAWVNIPFPWVRDDAIALTVVTNSGTTFEHEIEVATPVRGGLSGSLRAQTLLGAYVGILPVLIGLMFFPLLRRLAGPGMQFVLSITLGMLVFLLIDLIGEAIEAAHESAAAFQGTTMVLIVAGAVFLVLIGIGRRHGTPSGLALATYIALGIGLHNLGEGLAIGAAQATGAAGLGAFLIIGFTLHNVTEGIAIAAPLVRTKPTLLIFAALAILAGAPAIIGIWLGAQAVAPQWTTLAFAVGAGAILQVLFEVAAYIMRQRSDDKGGTDWAIIAGILVGLIVMYVTGLAIKV